MKIRSANIPSTLDLVSASRSDPLVARRLHHRPRAPIGLSTSLLSSLTISALVRCTSVAHAFVAAYAAKRGAGVAPGVRREDLMALISCEDCGKRVSDAAASCPDCGRPISTDGGDCSRCGEGTVITGSGLHGPLEIIATVVWAMATLIIGLVLYFYLSSRPWCPACRKRPTGTVSPVSLVFLILTGLFVGMWTFAILTGTAK